MFAIKQIFIEFEIKTIIVYEFSILISKKITSISTNRFSCYQLCYCKESLSKLSSSDKLIDELYSSISSSNYRSS